jgi:two-component system, OmpR family, copper resistance phosphate regulon response regulator CusR
MDGIKILLVEDERKIAGSLCQGLSEQHYRVDIAYDGVMGKRLFQDNHYDLAILDINLPLLNGYDLCNHIRIQNEKLPIIMLTARDHVEDKLKGFQSGADDYLAKPFDFKELLARIQAVLKRLQNYGPTGKVLRVADLTMHLDSMEVRRNDERITLTAKEFQLLEYFIRNKNRVLSRADIAVDVWDIDFDTRTNVIDVYVNFLRKKIDRNFSHKLIHTYVGVGYILKDNTKK